MDGPGRGRRRILPALVITVLLGGLLGVAWTVYDTATNRKDWHVMTGRERELRSLLPHVTGVERLGYTAWDPRVFRTQYTLAPTVVVRFDGKLAHHLVELRPGEKVNFKPATWRVVAQSPRGRFVLLKKRAAEERR